MLTAVVSGGLPDGPEDQSLFWAELSGKCDSTGNVLQNRSMYGLCIDFLGIRGRVISHALLIFGSFAEFLIKCVIDINSTGRVT